MQGSGYCYMHNPEVSEEEKREARQRGGENKALTIQTPLPPVAVGCPEDVLLLIGETINLVRGGRLDIKTANCLGFLSDKYIKAYEIMRLKDRLEAVESVLSKRT